MVMEQIWTKSYKIKYQISAHIYCLPTPLQKKDYNNIMQIVISQK